MTTDAQSAAARRFARTCARNRFVRQLSDAELTWLESLKTEDQDEYIGVLERELIERLRVNVGLNKENRDKK